MTPKVRKSTGRPPPRPGTRVVPSSSHHTPQPEPRPEPEPEPEPGSKRVNPQIPPLRLNDRLYNTLQALSSRLADIQSCNCPADCRGPNPVHTPPAPSREDPETPQRAPRCREVLKRSAPRHHATVTAEAEASMEIQLPRLGDTATGTLRMSVTVHTCPANKVSRRGVSQSIFFCGTNLYVHWRAFSSSLRSLGGRSRGNKAGHFSHDNMFSTNYRATNLNAIVLRRVVPHKAGAGRRAHRVHGILENPKTHCRISGAEQCMDQ